MNPSISADMTVYVVANISGHSLRIRAANKFIAQDARRRPASGQKLVVHMGNYIGRDNPAQENIGAIESILSSARRGGVFLKGENETRLFERKSRTDQLDEEIEELSKMKNVPSLGLATLIQWRDTRNDLLKSLKTRHEKFLESLHDFYALGDYVFGIEVDPLPSDKFGIFSAEDSSASIPAVNSRRLKFNIVTLDAVAVLRLRSDKKDLTIIGDPDMRQGDKETYEKWADAASRNEDTGPYHFIRGRSLPLPGRHECPVWTSPVLIPA